jgi:isopentenyl-diphosphate delta-isomerase
MTGGHDQAFKINQDLMRSCENKRWIFATGSLRRELEEITYKKDKQNRLLEWESLVKNHKGVVLGNLGLAQVIVHPIESIKELCERLRLSGLYVHLNPLQEVMQPEGTPQFKGGLESLRALCASLDVPVFLKETGSGFSHQSLKDLKGLNIGAVDVSGLGGTHWGRVEGLRSDDPNALKAQAARTFKDWGVTTYDSLLSFKELYGAKKESFEAWASGGLRNGLDAAIGFALGANICGFAKPFMEAALVSQSEIESKMTLIEFELRVALFCTNSSCIMELQRQEGALSWI